jgi:hypothetical protein
MAKSVGDRFEEIVMRTVSSIVNEEDTKDAVEEAVRDNVEFSEIVSELLSDDEEVKDVLKQKVRELLLKQIMAVESLEDFYEDGDDMHTDLRDAINVSELMDEMFKSDEELMAQARNKVKELIRKQVEDNLDSDDLPDWDELVDLMCLEDLVKEILKQDEVVVMIREKMIELLKSYIEEDIDADKLPDNLNEMLDIDAQIKQLLDDREFRGRINEKLNTVLETEVIGYIEDEDSGFDIREQFLNNPEVKLMAGVQVDFFLRDQSVLEKLKDSLKTKLMKDSFVIESFTQLMFEAMAKQLAERLFSRL